MKQNKKLEQRFNELKSMGNLRDVDWDEYVISSKDSVYSRDFSTCNGIVLIGNKNMGLLHQTDSYSKYLINFINAMSLEEDCPRGDLKAILVGGVPEYFDDNYIELTEENGITIINYHLDCESCGYRPPHGWGDRKSPWPVKDIIINPTTKEVLMCSDVEGYKKLN